MASQFQVYTGIVVKRLKEKILAQGRPFPKVAVLEKIEDGRELFHGRDPVLLGEIMGKEDGISKLLPRLFLTHFCSDKRESVWNADPSTSSG